MNNRSMTLGWVALSLIVQPGMAQPTQPISRSINLQECIALALKDNLDLRIERINPAVSVADLEIARAAYDPDFTFSGSHNYSLAGGGLLTNGFSIPPSKTEANTFSSGFTGVGPLGLSYNLSGRISESYGTQPDPFDTSGGSIGISLSQPLLRNFLIDVPRYNIAVAKNRLKVSELRLPHQIMSVVTSVELAYYEFIYALENVKVQEKALQLAERLFSENTQKLRIGTLARLDEKQSESQVASRQADLISAQRLLKTAQNNLKKLITARYGDWHDVALQPSESLSAVPVLLDLQTSWSKALTQRPDLLQSRLDLERQGITVKSVKYYKNQRLPELDLTGSYGFGASSHSSREFSDAFTELSRADKPSWSAGAVISFPLGNKAARNRYRQSKLVADQSLLQLKNLEETILIQVDEAVNHVRSSLDRVESTRKARTYSEDALQAEQTKLNTGRSTSFIVLQLQRDLTAAQSEHIRALADYNKALAQLALNEGTTLERLKLNVQVK